MEHLVRFTTADGRDGQHQADSLDDALHFVERLRNTEGAEQVRVYRMQELPIEFRTYYRVELIGADADAPASVTTPPAPPVAVVPAVAPAPPLAAARAARETRGADVEAEGITGRPAPATGQDSADAPARRRFTR